MPNIVPRPPSFLANLGEFSKKTAINVCVSVIVPLVSGFVGSIATIDQVFLGAFIFVITLLGQIILDVGELKKERQPAIEFWRVQTDADRALSNVRASFSQIGQSQNKLYIQYFSRQMDELARNIHDAASHHELRVAQDSDTTEIMLRPFHEQEGRGIRAVHYFEDNEFMFEIHSSHFFRDVVEGVDVGRIKFMRRLFIIKDDSELEDHRSKQLIAFHTTTQGFDYKILRKRDFEKIKRDFNLPTDTRDFGVYGDWYVYRTTVAGDNEIKGIFNSSDATVRQFTAMFDRCWNSDFAYEVDRTPASRLSLRELFGPDAVSPNRPDVVQHTSVALPQLSSPDKDADKDEPKKG